ncbi:MAG: HypC/HybG/HupF family hydrogenase formation chaperone [Gemmatimonadota bacterium]|nr:MAG: HypC/HybG/HupF family hydrogenase formation chaperone [Gemmatimonadota bacterium]
MCVGVPGRIADIRQDGSLRMGIVDFGGATREVCLSYVDGEAGIGDFVIVHAGFAISVLNEREAERSLRLLNELDTSVDIP